MIVPAYNEAERIDSTLASLTNYLSCADLSYELIVVSDGSTDDTDLIARRRAGPQLRVISSSENRGKGHAVRSGVAAARGAYIMFIDADLTIPIAIVPSFLDALADGYDIAIASRRHPQSGAQSAARTRRLLGTLFAWCVRLILVRGIGDTQCGAKVYRAPVAQRLFAAQRIDHFSFDAEVLYLAWHAGYRVKEVPVTLQPRPGSSVRPLRDAMFMLRDLLRVRLYAWRGAYERSVR